MRILLLMNILSDDEYPNDRDPHSPTSFHAPIVPRYLTTPSQVTWTDLVEFLELVARVKQYVPLEEAGQLDGVCLVARVHCLVDWGRRA